MPNRLGGVAMGASVCADAAYAAARTRMDSFCFSLSFTNVALSLLRDNLEDRRLVSDRRLGFYEEELRIACSNISSAAYSDPRLIDEEPPEKKKPEEDGEAAIGATPGNRNLASFGDLFELPLNQKELSAPLWNRFYNSTVMQARSIDDISLRNLHLTLLNEGCQYGAGAFVNAIGSNPFTRFSSAEFKDVLRYFLGLSSAGCKSDHVHTHACGKMRNKPMELRNCSAPDGVAALADSSVHLSHCHLNGRSHLTSAAVECSIMEMVKAAGFGHSWRRQVTLVSQADSNGHMTWRSDLVGYDEKGRLVLIDVGVKTIGAASYRGQRIKMMSRTQKALAAVEKEKTDPKSRAAGRAKDLGAKLIPLIFSSNGGFSRQSQEFFKRVCHHARLRGLSHMGVSFPRAETSWTTTFFSTYWRQRIVCCMCGTSAAATLKLKAGDQLYQSQLKTGAKGAKEFVRPYGREGFETPVAGRSESDLAANDSAADFATDAAAAAFGADGTFRSPAVLPGDGDGDPGGGGDGDTDWGAAWPASDLEEAQLEEAQLAQRMENCSMDVHLPLTNNNAIEYSKCTTPSVVNSAIVMQDNDNNDDVLWCVKCGDTCECDWR
jgi:hypothetical protein